ncbi:MAG: hypothetical protein AAF583_01480 [Pseudomonadota bacterium]
MSYSETNKHGHTKQPFAIADDITELANMTLMTLQIVPSVYSGNAACLSFKGAGAGRRIAGDKVGGGRPIMSWDVEPADVLQALFSRQELVKIATALAESSA